MNPRDREFKAAAPTTFLSYLRSFGPGIIVVLTWLGAGDIVEVGVAGGNFGYALMWVICIAIGMRFLFVSLIAKYQLCNQHGESVLDGLARISAAYPLFLFVAAIVMGHVYGAYMTVGVGEACANFTGRGEIWHWAILWNALALFFVIRPVFDRIEWLFKVFLILLSVSLLASAVWVGPNPMGILRGTLAFEVPPQAGPYDSMLIAIGMIGAVGGSLMNLVYPYFLENKGWIAPEHRRLQTYDFLLAMLVMLILNLAIWTLGAELLHPKGLEVEELDDLPRLLSETAGAGGRVLFYLGIFAAIYSSLIGHALGLGYLGSHAYQRCVNGGVVKSHDYRNHPCYRYIAAWCLISPLIWTAPGMPGFVFLTLIANSAQVILIPFLAGGLWWITSQSSFIGRRYRNNVWENGVMAVLFGLAIWSAYEGVRSVYQAIQDFAA